MGGEDVKLSVKSTGASKHDRERSTALVRHWCVEARLSLLLLT